MASLSETVRGLFAQGFVGLNVTIPHKQAILPLMDELANSARIIGAVNTIVKREGRLIGHNTDAAGFMRGLTHTGFAPAGSEGTGVGCRRRGTRGSLRAKRCRSVGDYLEPHA